LRGQTSARAGRSASTRARGLNGLLLEYTMTQSLPSRAARLLPALLILNACSSSDRPTAPRVGQEALMRPGPPPANPAIAFTAGQTTLWVMNADGSNQTQITSTVGSLASWAPFGDGTPANPYAIAYEPKGRSARRDGRAVG